MEPKIGRSHLARKALFRRGLRQGHLAVADIEAALPAGSLTQAERWLLYYSLRAAEIEILGEPPEAVEEFEVERRARDAEGPAGRGADGEDREAGGRQPPV